MVNLLISMRCNRDCGYCFAKEKRMEYDKKGLTTDIEMVNVKKVIQFLEYSGCNTLQLAGGEPTLHQEFQTILGLFLSRRMQVNVLSNCLWNDDHNSFFKKVSPARLGFLLNIDHPSTYSKNEWTRVHNNLSHIKGRGNITLSFNIFETNPKYQYLLDLISEYNFDNVRLSFSMPVVYKKSRNEYLELKEYWDAKPSFFSIIQSIEALDGTVRLDNTIPLCLFTPDEMNDLLLTGILNMERNLVCYPVIDVGPDLSIWRCFGTSGIYNKKLTDFISLYEIYDYYNHVLHAYQFEVYPFEQCNGCKYSKWKMCQGGCLGYSIEKLMKVDGLIEQNNTNDIMNKKLHINKEISIKQYEYPETETIIHLGDGEFIDINQKLLTFIELLNGNLKISDAINIYLNQIQNIELSEEFEHILKDEVIENIIKMLRQLYYRGVLIEG